jgi:hypothetical protein
LTSALPGKNHFMEKITVLFAAVTAIIAMTGPFARGSGFPKALRGKTAVSLRFSQWR